MLNEGGIGAKFLWLDALPVANQQESVAGPHLFPTTITPEQGKGRHSLYVGSLMPVPRCTVQE